MVVRTQISLDADKHRRAKRRAAERGISFAEYIRQVVDRDLGEEPKADISAISGLFASGRSDISSNVDKYLGESLWKEHLSRTGQQDRLSETSRQDGFSEAGRQDGLSEAGRQDR